jgi:hypothetical protein
LVDEKKDMLSSLGMFHIKLRIWISNVFRKIFLKWNLKNLSFDYGKNAPIKQKKVVKRQPFFVLNQYPSFNLLKFDARLIMGTNNTKK